MKELLISLRDIKGSKAKTLALEAHRNVPELRKYLSHVFDCYTRYHVATKQAAEFGKEPDEMFYSMLQRMSWLNGNLQARELMGEMIRIYGRFATLVLNHTLDCGVGASTVAKVFGPEVAPTFDVILATAMTPDKVKLPALASIKFDGVRVIVIKSKEDHMARFFTRGGREFRLDHLVMELPTEGHYMLDAELIYEEGATEDRTSISGKVNSSLAGTITEIPGSTLQIFDYMTHREWSEKDCRSSYELRYASLKEFESNHIKVVEQVTVASTQELERRFTELLEQGMEGLILRYPEDLYEWKRTKKLIKMKAIKECELECIGIKPGTGKYEGKIGALVCKGTVEGIDIEVSVGSGLSDYDREQDPNWYVGSTIEVDYNVVIDNSLFLPRFKRIAEKVDQ